MRKQNKIQFEVTLPKGFRIDDVNTKTIPLDESWETTVRENHRNIDKLPLKDARQKYG